MADIALAPLRLTAEIIQFPTRTEFRAKQERRGNWHHLWLRYEQAQAELSAHHYARLLNSFYDEGRPEREAEAIAAFNEALNELMCAAAPRKGEIATKQRLMRRHFRSDDKIPAAWTMTLRSDVERFAKTRERAA